MAFGYAAKPNLLGQPTSQPKPQGNIRNVYDAAVTQNADDYDNIREGYDSLQQRARSNQNNSPLNYVPVNPIFNRNIQGINYQRSDDLNTAITGLKDYSNTGGYSDADIGNIRERGISPIRSIYDSARRGVERNKVLQGGYAPNYGAVMSKMARESAGQIGDVTTRVNADIAKMVASGKLSGLQSLGSVASRDNELMNQANARNTEMQNEVERMNADEQRRVDELNAAERARVDTLNRGVDQQNFNNELNAVQGKQSLYGTTPALTQTFANQALQDNAQSMQAVTTANNIKQQRANVGLNLIGRLGGRA